MVSCAHHLSVCSPSHFPGDFFLCRLLDWQRSPRLAPAAPAVAHHTTSPHRHPHAVHGIAMAGVQEQVDAWLQSPQGEKKVLQVTGQPRRQRAM